MIIFSRLPLLIPLLLILLGCSTTGSQIPDPIEATQALNDSPRDFTQETSIEQLYNSRTWVPPNKLKVDPIELGNKAKIPDVHARTKILGSPRDQAIRALAAKIWLIEHAQHTVDITYYVFWRDLTGYAVLGALCNAVKRGVDVRIMMDSLASYHMTHSELKALESCTEEAGYIRDANGQPTQFRARVQPVIINSLTKTKSWVNRRSHDKLLVIDGNFPGKDFVITGGRNLSMDYYGINDDGSPKLDYFVDLEILIRSSEDATKDGGFTVGKVSSAYFTVLSLHRGNRRIRPPVEPSDDDVTQSDPYFHQRKKAQKSLAHLKSLADIKAALADMPTYLNEGFHESKVRLAHELGNLTSEDVVQNALELEERNQNSIVGLLKTFINEAAEANQLNATLRIVSPYIFIATYQDNEGNVVWDGAKEIHKLLDKHPDFKIEIITNSILTTDNNFTQSIIDMDLAPRLLLSPEMKKAWLSELDEGEFNPEVVESDEWKQQINNPRIKIYETGKIDSTLLGGEVEYGKLHAKFVFDEVDSFVGTSNFDYRSRLFNNEMGFFVRSPALSQELLESYNYFKSRSYLWGSPEWLAMRRIVMESDTSRGQKTKSQRRHANFLKSSGLVKQF